MSFPFVHLPRSRTHPGSGAWPRYYCMKGAGGVLGTGWVYSPLQLLGPQSLWPQKAQPLPPQVAHSPSPFPAASDAGSTGRASTLPLFLHGVMFLRAAGEVRQELSQKGRTVTCPAREGEETEVPGVFVLFLWFVFLLTLTRRHFFHCISHINWLPPALAPVWPYNPGVCP